MAVGAAGVAGVAHVAVVAANPTGSLLAWVLRAMLCSVHRIDFTHTSCPHLSTPLGHPLCTHDQLDCLSLERGQVWDGPSGRPERALEEAQVRMRAQEGGLEGGKVLCHAWVGVHCPGELAVRGEPLVSPSETIV